MSSARTVTIKGSHEAVRDDSDKAIAAAQAMADSPDVGALKEQLKQCYAAIVRLRENTDLRYNLLEGKYLDLKRTYAEAESRRERAEAQNEALKAQVHKLKTEKTRLQQTHRKLLGSANQTKLKAVNDYHSLCRLVLLCDECEQHIDDDVINKLSSEEITNVYSQDGGNLELLLGDENGEEGVEESSVSTQDNSAIKAMHPNQDAAHALLGKDLEDVVEMNVDQEDVTTGKFANLSESAKEQKLKGHHSHLVEAQSGVYCKINHDTDIHQITPIKKQQHSQLVSSPLSKMVILDTVDVDDLDDDDASIGCAPAANNNKEQLVAAATPATPPRAGTPPRHRLPTAAAKEFALPATAVLDAAPSPRSPAPRGTRPKRSSFAPKRNKRNASARENKLNRKVSFGELMVIPGPVLDDDDGHEEEKSEIEPPTHDETPDMPNSIETNLALNQDNSSVNDEVSEVSISSTGKKRVSKKLSSKERKARRDARLKEAKKSAKDIQKKARELKKAEASNRSMLENSRRSLNATDASENDNASVLSNLTGDSGSRKAGGGSVASGPPSTSSSRKSWKGMFKQKANTVVTLNRMNTK